MLSLYTFLGDHADKTERDDEHVVTVWINSLGTGRARGFRKYVSIIVTR